MALRARTRIVLFAGVFALALALAFAATHITSLQGSGLPQQRASGERAPDFTGIARWFNSEPLRISQLRGKVVWVDFWTYSCINCVRTLPFVKEFYERYHAAGLDVIGVHSPEFNFEKVPANVQAAVARYGLPYPVAMDNDMATWRAYGNQYWPRVYLIDARGDIAYDHAGEGGEDELQTQVRALLSNAGVAHLPAPIDFARFNPSADITPEIYAGYERGGQEGTLANREGYRPGSVVSYAPVTEATVRATGTGGAFFLDGRWLNAAEYVQAAGGGAHVLLPFKAQHVYMVAQTAAGAVTVRVSIDGVERAAVRVDHSDLYELASLPAVQTHVLTLDAPAGFRLYTFTFG